MKVRSIITLTLLSGCYYDYNIFNDHDIAATTDTDGGSFSIVQSGLEPSYPTFPPQALVDESSATEQDSDTQDLGVQDTDTQDTGLPPEDTGFPAGDTDAAGAADSDVDVVLDCDLDDDGHDDASCGGGDCNDSNPSIHPLAGDSYDDDVDADCDGLRCNAYHVASDYFTVCLTEAHTFWEANDLCLASGYDGLSSIRTPFESDSIMSARPQKTGDANYWIGLHRMPSEHSYTWLDGYTIDLSMWAPGEPTGAPGGPENVVEIEPMDYTPSHLRDYWNDVPETLARRGFVCGKRG